MSEYHEPESEISPKTRDLHRALKSLTEELEAIDWYQQRWDVCQDETLRAILAHNRDEEIEHATMTLEWLRRNMAKWDEVLRTYLFTEAPITTLESAKEAAEVQAEGGGALASPGTERASPADLGIGSLKVAR